MLISPQTEEHVREFKKEKGFTMELLSDPGNRVADDYRLVYTVTPELKKVYLDLGIDVETFNGDDSWRLPMPARYIVDKNRVIRYAEINPDHTTRPEPEDTLKALKDLNL